MLLLSLLGAAFPAPTLDALDWPLEAGTRLVFTDAEGREGLILTTEGDGRVAVRGPPVFFSGESFVLERRGEDWILPVSTSYLGDARNDPPWVVLDLPLTPGRSWVTGRTGGDTRFTFRATVGGLESISTPYGDLEAWRVEYRLECHLGTERDFDAWFVDGIGLVQLRQVASSTLGDKTPLRPPPTVSLAAIGEIGVAWSTAPEPDWLTVTATARGEGVVGEPLPVAFSLVNTGPEPMRVITALDASDVGWRYPKIDIEIEQVGVGPVAVEPLGRCGLMNPLTRRDLQLLSPGGSLDPLGPGTFGHHLLDWTPTRPGTYRVRMIYDLGTPDRWTQAPPELIPELSSLPAGRHVSNTVTVIVR